MTVEVNFSEKDPDGKQYTQSDSKFGKMDLMEAFDEALVETEEVQASTSPSPPPKPKRRRIAVPSSPNHDLPTDPSLQPLSPRVSMTVGRPLPLLICSIGNPGSQYANTLHSAGHIVLKSLAAHLGYPPFQKDKDLGKGLVSRPSSLTDHADWTLWQSPSYMNDSGKSVRAAYLAWSKSLPDDEGRLVVIHDELEKPLGAVSLRIAQGASAKGHNGLKSIIAVMGNTPFARIGIGIGRPVSRESDDVARYVLRKMDTSEKQQIDASVEAVIAKLRTLEKG